MGVSRQKGRVVSLRRKPYTQIGIARLPCGRCGRRPATTQFQICADDNIWRVLCRRCDIQLNRIVLRFFNDPEVTAKLSDYIGRVS